MESVLASHKHQNLPYLEPSKHEGISSIPFSSASIQISHHSGRYSTSSTNTCLEDSIAFNVSRSHVPNFTQCSNNVGFMPYRSKAPLESMDPNLLYQPSAFQEFERETLNSLKEFSRVSKLELASSMKRGCSNNNNNNLLAKGETDKCPQGIIIKGQWSQKEDRSLIALVKQHGSKDWNKISRLLTGRVGKQCRERWQNHLRPDLKKGEWTEEEEKLLIQLHMEFGSRWSLIARRMPGRSDNTVKNHWYATKRSRYTSSSKRNTHNGSCNRYLEDYIRSCSSKSQQHIDLKENSPSRDSTSEAVENMMNYPLLEEGSSSPGLKQDGEEVAIISPYIPLSLEDDHKKPFYLSTLSEFDEQREQDFIKMLYEGYP